MFSFRNPYLFLDVICLRLIDRFWMNSLGGCLPQWSQYSINSYNFCVQIRKLSCTLNVANVIDLFKLIYSCNPKYKHSRATKISQHFRILFSKFLYVWNSNHIAVRGFYFYVRHYFFGDTKIKVLRSGQKMKLFYFYLQFSPGRNQKDYLTMFKRQFNLTDVTNIVVASVLLPVR